MPNTGKLKLSYRATGAHVEDSIAHLENLAFMKGVSLDIQEKKGYSSTFFRITAKGVRSNVKHFQTEAVEYLNKLKSETPLAE